jgi:hypothetical protein
MFPTFISFTNRHPRYVAVVGFSIFILGVVLLGYAYLSTQQVEVARCFYTGSGGRSKRCRDLI